MTALMFVAGLVLLVIGAELSVRGASKPALFLGISPLVVGLTVVAFGASSPELAASIDAAISGSVDLAIGNAAGSNIHNVLPILGPSAILAPLLVAQHILRQEVPIMIGASVLLFSMALDGELSRMDGVVLLALFLTCALFLIQPSRAARAESPSKVPAPATWDSRRGVQLLLIVVGLIPMEWGADLLADSAIVFAKALGVSELGIGLTIVAAGTSMSEVASLVLAFDLPVMLAVSMVGLAMFLRAGTINRWEGLVFLGYYVAFAAYLIPAAGDHDALEPFRAAIWSMVLLLTIVSMVVMQYREWRRETPL